MEGGEARSDGCHSEKVATVLWREGGQKKQREARTVGFGIRLLQEAGLEERRGRNIKAVP